MRWFDKKWPALLLFPLSLLYGGVMELRNAFYHLGIFKSRRVACPVISVGNITVGGTGKTPAVQMLVNELLKRGKRPVIISRGYGRKSKGTVVVSDGKTVFASAAEAGDEPLMLAHNCPGTAVIVDADRVRAAELAIERFQPDVIVLDDGFQHRKIARDVDIVAVRRTQPFGNGFCLPAGPLREPLHHLFRAHLVLVTGDDDAPLPNLEKYQLSIVTAHYEMIDCVSVSGAVLSPDELVGRRALVFCGLGNPHNFLKTVKNIGVNISCFKTFKDHHIFDERDIAAIKRAADDEQVELILTTEKDWVKLETSWMDARWMRVRMALKSVDSKLFVSRFEKIIQ